MINALKRVGLSLHQSISAIPFLPVSHPLNDVCCGMFVCQSTTLYIGNLSFYTDEEQVYTLFSLCGPVRRVIMGIHKFTHLPCGFCFVELSALHSNPIPSVHPQ